MKCFFINRVVVLTSIFLIVIILVLLIIIPKSNHYVKNSFTRGLIVASSKEGALVSWRSLEEDNSSITFKLYKNNVLLKEFNYKDPNNYIDKEHLENDKYTLEVYKNKKIIEIDTPEILFKGINKGNSGAYFDIPLDIPQDIIMPNNEIVTYSPNDVVAYDVDGDGLYEFIVKWDPSNSKDNSELGYTGNVYIDCYKITGQKLWRIDMGKNIRAGASYTQILVYDYDLDGRAEVILKTADGTVDAMGTVIGDINIDNRNKNGIILTGNEYLTLFDGITGKILDTIFYYPERGSVKDWGDDYGNRSDRFLAATAYLDGSKPSAVLIRGYYTRTVAVSYNVVGKKLKRLWLFDTNENNQKINEGSGNHQVIPADVDSDGKDEIVLGSLVLDDDGKVLYNSYLGHGDVLHVGDFNLENEGLEIFMSHETENFGISLRDGKTGKILFRKNGEKDTGRGIIDNFISNNSTTEMVGLQDSLVYNTYGDVIGNWNEDNKEWSKNKDKGINFLVYWDDSIERELLDDIQIKRYSDEKPLFIGEGVKSINDSKRNPSLSADLYGDYREEVIYPTEDNRFLRVFTTTIYSPYNVNTLMQNRHYKLQVLLQNIGYNQPPHLDYFLGN